MTSPDPISNEAKKENMDRLFDAFKSPEPAPTSHSLFVGAFFGSYSVEDSSVDDRTNCVSFDKTVDEAEVSGDTFKSAISSLGSKAGAKVVPKGSSKSTNAACVTPDSSQIIKNRNPASASQSEAGFEIPHLGSSEVSSVADEVVIGSKSKEVACDASVELSLPGSTPKEDVEAENRSTGGQASLSSQKSGKERKRTISFKKNSNAADSGSVSSRQSRVSRTYSPAIMEDAPVFESGLPSTSFASSILPVEISNGNSAIVDQDESQVSRGATIGSANEASVGSTSRATPQSTAKTSPAATIGSKRSRAQRREGRSPAERANNLGNQANTGTPKERKPRRWKLRGPTQHSPFMKINSSRGVPDDYSWDTRTDDGTRTTLNSHGILSESPQPVFATPSKTDPNQLDGNCSQSTNPAPRKRIATPNRTANSTESAEKQLAGLAKNAGSPIEKATDLTWHSGVSGTVRGSRADGADRIISMEEGLHRLKNIDSSPKKKDQSALADDSPSYKDEVGSTRTAAIFSIATNVREELGITSNKSVGSLSTEGEGPAERKTGSKGSRRSIGQKDKMMVRERLYDTPEKRQSEVDVSMEKDESLQPEEKRAFSWDLLRGAAICICLIGLVVAAALILPFWNADSGATATNEPSNLVPTSSPISSPTGSPLPPPPPRYEPAHEIIWRVDGTAFGSSVAYMEHVLLVGMSDVNTVRTYSVNHGRVELLGTVQGSQLGSGFGWSLDIASPSLIVTGAPFLHAFGSTTSVGGAYVFEFVTSTGTWTQFGPIIRGDEDSFADQEHFGASVSASSFKDAIRVAVGAPRSSLESKHNVGRVYIFERLISSKGNWNVVGQRPIYGEKIGDRFGSSLDLSNDGSTFFAGAPGSLLHEDPGYVLGYRLVDGQWENVVNLTGSEPNEEFGSSITILDGIGDVFAVGAPSFKENSGRVMVFERDDDGSFQQMGSDILGSFGERIGDTKGLDGVSTAIGFAIIVSSATGVVKRYEYESGDWVKSYETLDTGFDSVSSLSCSGSNCEQLATGSLRDQALSIYGAANT